MPTPRKPRFQSTRPARGATTATVQARVLIDISIHAPREGRDRRTRSTMPAIVNFNPRAPRGARLVGVFAIIIDIYISIHAPREGRDRQQDRKPHRRCNFNPRAPRGARPLSSSNALTGTPFQSTRPARGATFNVGDIVPFFLISIHAPREGRDLTAQSCGFPATQISIHAPREGRDCIVKANYVSTHHFNPRAPRGARLGLRLKRFM